MRIDTWGPLRVRLAGGADREGGGDGPVVVLCHGFGAPGDDLVGLWRVMNVPRETRFVFPEAPLSLAEGFGESRAWWMIDMVALERAIETGERRDLSHEVPDGLDSARDKLVQMLEVAEQRLGVSYEEMVLGGFSQGSMLALDTALGQDRKPKALILMSSTLLSEQRWLPRMPGLKDTPVLQSHGELDPLLPFDMAEKLRDALRQAGVDVRWIPFRGAHEIPQPVLDAVEHLLASVA